MVRMGIWVMEPLRPRTRPARYGIEERELRIISELETKGQILDIIELSSAWSIVRQQISITNLLSRPTQETTSGG